MRDHLGTTEKVWLGSFAIQSQVIYVRLASGDRGLSRCHISLTPLENDSDAVMDGKPVEAECPHLGKGVEQLTAYFAGQRKQFDLSLDYSDRTPFQQEVWKAALQIPYGQTRSYWWVAVRAGNPLAARAVGGALGANPLPLFIPCHRVVRTDGSVGGFTGGVDIKRVLLQLEEGHEPNLLDVLESQG